MNPTPRIAIRNLVRSKAFLASAVASLALGIGPTVAVAVLVHQVVLRPLPFEEPAQLVSVWETDQGRDLDRLYLSAPAFLDLMEGNRSFEALAAYNVGQYTLTQGGDPTRVYGAAATPALFRDVFRTRLSLGRTFHAEEELPGSPPVAILSHGLWKKRFHGNPDVLGQPIVLDDEPHVIVGILPESFEFENPEADLLVDIQIWKPLQVQRYMRYGRGLRFLRAIGRLKEAVEPVQAEADLAAVLASEAGSDYNPGGGRGVRVVRLHEQLVQPVARSLWVLLTAVLLLLLVAWGNVLNLLLVRHTERHVELGVRTAIGATARHLLRELIAENTALAVLGAVPGTFLGLWLTDLLIGISPREIPRLKQGVLHLEVVLITVAIALATALLLSLATAPLLSRRRAGHALSNAGRSLGSPRHLARDAFVVAEVALSAVLLVCGGLLVKSLWALQRVDLAFDPDHVLVGKIELPSSRYGDEERILGFYRGLAEGVRAVPGVVDVGFAKDLPLSGEETQVQLLPEASMEGPSGEQETELAVACRIATPGYLETMKIRVVRGVGLSEGRGSAPARFLVNESLAHRLSGGGDILGRQIGIDWFGQERVGEVAGVVADVRHRNPRLEPQPAVYVPLDRLAYPILSIVVRGRGEPTSLVPDLRRVVHDLDPQLPLVEVEPLQQRVDRALATERFLSLLIGGFGIAALILSIVGLYGVLSYSVSKERHQIGVRMALGAGRMNVMSLVLGRTLGIVAIGVALGLAGGFAFSSLLSSLFFGVGSADPTTSVAVVSALAVLALAASLPPARRAMKIDPATALREL